MAAPWRVAESLKKLREQVNLKFPGRSKASDGSIGNAEHATRNSDHNPYIKDGVMGVVTAIDITHDPKNGFDSYKFADHLLREKDSRIKYVISNGRIGSGRNGPRPWIWRPYTGVNHHDHHVHISVIGEKSIFDNPKLWNIDSELTKRVLDPEAPSIPPRLQQGAHGIEVEILQELLNSHGFTLYVDQDFGPRTNAAVLAFQLKNDLIADGVVGPATWKALKAP